MNADVIARSVKALAALAAVVGFTITEDEQAAIMVVLGLVYSGVSFVQAYFAKNKT